MLTSTNTKRRVHFDDLLDIAPANDAGSPAPQLRSLSQYALRATVSHDSQDNLYAGLSYDVVTGGIFVATYDMPPVGARIDLTVTLPTGKELELTGVVRWVRDAELASEGLPAGCGIEWKGLPVEVCQTLELFAETREPLLWLADAA